MLGFCVYAFVTTGCRPSRLKALIAINMGVAAACRRKAVWRGVLCCVLCTVHSWHPKSRQESGMRHSHDHHAV